MNARLPVTVVCALFLAPLEAAPSPCQEPPSRAQLRLDLESGQSVNFQRLGNTHVAVDRRRLRFQSGGADTGKVSVGFGHEYSVIDVGAILTPGTGLRELSSNGHVHTTFLDIDFSGRIPQGWIFRVQPGFSASSNILTRPQRIRGDGLQLNAALLRRLASAATSTLLIGLCGDHRFGEYRVYPRLAWLWQGKGWTVEAGFPDSEVSLALSQSARSGLRIYPNGNRWHVHGEPGGFSFLTHEAWQLQWYLGWRLNNSLHAEFNLGALANSEYEFMLKDGTSINVESESPWQIGIGIVWKY